MDNKILMGAIALVLVTAGFFTGMSYGKSTAVPSTGQFGQTGGPGGAAGGARFRGGMGGFTTGKIISSDATSITLQAQDGSTKIILVSATTQINKMAAGTMKDLSVGTVVSTSGTTNSDGSVTAQMVQIRPAGFASSTPRGQ